MENTGRVLIIEDDRDLAGALETALSEAGYEVVVARDGENGLRLAIETPPDVIVLDIILPSIRGTVLLPRLRDYAWGKSVKVIMVSNVDDDEKRQLAERANAFAYLVKSDTSLEDIVRTVKHAMLS